MTQKTQVVKQGLSVSGNSTITGTLNVTGALTQNSVQVKLVGDTIVREEVHTWAISGVGDNTTTFVPFAINEGSGETVQVSRTVYRCGGGTPTIKLTKNGSDLTGFTSISVTSTQAETNPTDQDVADKDEICVVCTAGSWTGFLYVTVMFTRSKNL